DKDGDIYVTGISWGTWGSPLHPFAGERDAFAAKLNSNGTLIWNTFMGSSTSDYGYGIAVDGSGNVYVAGHSYATWGNPVIDHTGESGYDNPDAFAAKLNSSGETVWNTFMGSSDQIDFGYGIAVDESGNAYVTGYSDATWGSPLHPFAGNTDAFAVKLDASGETVWTTFMGSSDDDLGMSIALDGSANVYVAGISYDSWGHPVKDHYPNFIEDGFVAKLTSSGETVWNTFVGYNSRDKIYGMALDEGGSIFLTGTTLQPWSQGWGTPVNPYSGASGDEVFVVKLNNSGETVWHTYMGSSSSDEGRGIATDSYGNVYVTGYSYDTWGNPANDHTSGLNWDIFAAKLNSSGVRKWNTFMGVEGVSSMDWGESIAATKKGNFYITGKSQNTDFVVKFLKGNMTPWKPLLLLDSSGD
ncbi:MAG: SBBP repeat-containing protein, partial [Deltaproteobacteria bacterium]|nr:SBBP repeat-containing protein [Deltaproteobacteria bacterium]